MAVRRSNLAMLNLPYSGIPYGASPPSQEGTFTPFCAEMKSPFHFLRRTPPWRMKLSNDLISAQKYDCCRISCARQDWGRTRSDSDHFGVPIKSLLYRVRPSGCLVGHFLPKMAVLPPKLGRAGKCEIISGYYNKPKPPKTI